MQLFFNLVIHERAKNRSLVRTQAICEIAGVYRSSVEHSEGLCMVLTGKFDRGDATAIHRWESRAQNWSKLAKLGGKSGKRLRVFSYLKVFGS